MASDETTSRHENASAPPSLSLIVSCAGGLSSVPLAFGRKYVVGRAAGADIVLNDGSVSRRHALLDATGDLSLEDLGSRNGSRVRGVTLRPGQRAQLDIGVVVEIGQATLLVQNALPEAPASASSSSGTNRPKAPARGTRMQPEPIANTPEMKRLYGMLDILAPSSLNVVVLGETGVGKEVFAAALHERSARHDLPFLRLNCAALPESVLEGELFGYERGAFTGATQARPGLFESAHGGTVFLDEIGELPMSTQAKLLRVLESGEVLRLGSRQPVVVDVRFVAATHRDLRFLITSGGFRSDLYFRLNGISVVIPPLRERRSEVRPLAERFLASAAGKIGRRTPSLGERAAGLLEAYDWPGNVRELRNIVERALAFCREDDISCDALLAAAPELAGFGGEPRLPDTTGTMAPVDVGPASAPTLIFTQPLREGALRLRSEIESFEREHILAALAKTAGNQKRAAEVLGISRRTLVNKLDAYDIERPRKGTK